MNEKDLEAELLAAMEPYLRSFLKQRDAATFEVSVSGKKAIAVLILGSSDFKRIRGQKTLRSHFSRCYNELCRHLDKKRIPSLDYEKAPATRGAKKRKATTRKPTKRKATKRNAARKPRKRSTRKKKRTKKTS